MAAGVPSIEDFKSLVTSRGGLARPNLFSVLLPNIGTNAESPKNLGFLCSNITLPSRKLATVQREIGADRQDVVYGFNNPEVSMTFRVLNNQGARRYFEEWQGLIHQKIDDQEGRYQVNYADNYCFPVHIYQWKKGWSIPIANKSKDFKLGPLNINLDLDLDLGTKGTKNYHWLLDRAYPVSITYETFAEGQNEVSQFNIDFAYKSWVGEFMSDNDTLGVTATGAVSTNAKSLVTNKIYDILKI